MFRSCSAWFSQSVSRDLCDFWVAEGGVITNHHDADYLFSSDASCPDTQRIHKSCDYIDGKATVFHSCYLSANTSSEMKQTVLLGHFILPPACLQEEIKRKIGSFIWEQMNNSQIEQLEILTPAEIKTVGEEKEQRIRGKRDLTRSIEKPVTRKPAGEKLSCYPLQDYPVNNMVTGHVPASEMRKYVGELRDFIPGTSDYVAYWVQDEINIFSDVKNKLKRKL
ncbi:PREDICTED: telomere repeats-binding bouquet formation protein 2 [Gavialis gangeticus]|uniref:telomere repeats-binding bouquet formation protein 2 n=1 Tax=Gavialis gangeticus TaxID=94835 RepID=UPI00092E9C5B|nr:PREDICTED: telomere repeats-binding bouquet formation protein 2 [Gavialis gangeticus]